MTRLNALRGRLRRLLRNDARDREIDEELQFHVDMQTEANRRAGMPPEEARRMAMVAFGGSEGHKEACRDLRRTRPLENLLMDVRFALRHFRRAPLSTATMVLVLVLGIGANAALFATAQSVITLPAPGIPRNDALVRIRALQRAPHFGQMARPIPYAEVMEYARHDELFRGVAAWTDEPSAIDLGDAEHGIVSARATYVTGDYFQILGVVPILGAELPSTTGTADASTTFAAVISHALWDQYFGRAADVVGKTLKVNGFPVSIVGVAPPRFAGVDPTEKRGLWLPLSAWPLLEGGGSSDLRSDSVLLRAVARLSPGVTAEEATPTVRAIGTRATPRTFGGEAMDPSAELVPLLRGNANPGADARNATLAALFGGVTLLILLITCTNVSGLLVGGAVTRRREIAVRLSLGASRARVIRQLLTESVLLAFAAGLLASLLLVALMRGLHSWIPELQFALDWRALAFTFGLALLTGVAFGLSPAMHATRLDVGEVLKDSAAAVSGSRSWLQRGILVTQIALTQPLLVGLGALLLLVGGELNTWASREVYEHIASLDFEIYAGNFSLEARRVQMDRIAERLQSTPGVIAVVGESGGFSPKDVVVPPEDRVSGVPYPERLRVRLESTRPGYFDLMDVAIVRGRDFATEERQNGGSGVIIGGELARTLWGPANPIGRRLRYAVSPTDSSERVVVGVFDEKTIRATEMGEPHLFVPASGGLSSTLLVRTAGPAEAMIPTLRAVATAEAPQIPISRATTLAAREAEVRSMIMRVSAAAAAGGLLALFLSAIGLYAVISTAVGQRMREIGIRTAMGARTQQVVGMFFASGLRLTVVGLLIGLPLSLLSLKVLALRVEMPQASMPLLAGMIALVTVAVAMFATWIPARRAASIDPLISLRSE
jgi:predicted permease